MLPNSVCPVCGSVYYRYPSQIARNVRVTCSHTCAARHFRDKGTTVSCVRNKPFYRRRSIAEKGFSRFCSPVSLASMWKPCKRAGCQIKMSRCVLALIPRFRRSTAHLHYTSLISRLPVVQRKLKLTAGLKSGIAGLPADETGKQVAAFVWEEHGAGPRRSTSEDFPGCTS
jgi:hypothetical protein